MLSKFKAIIIAVLVAAMLSVTASAQQDFTFTTPDGKSVTLSGLRGRVVVLLFGGTQDPQCQDEFKALEELARQYEGKDVSIYWVSVNSAKEVSDAQLRAPCGPTGSVVVLRDTNQTAFKRFSGKVAQLPTIVVLNKQGELQGQPRGGFNPNTDFVNDLRAVIDSLLSK
ncbi:MAG TPA: TlpA disulfide reductase family protein [Blastocatellia bacterium]|nr:TlpA disulfide reductase family protein [Blastocatellia bacterium]